jgi:hypothetical protein
MSSTTRAKRIRRIETRGSRELLEAMRTRAISVRMADSLLLLPPDQQAAELQRRLQAVQERERKSKTIAGVIRGYLDAHKEVDLEELRSLIQAALARASVGN